MSKVIRIICSLENASSEINGVQFSEDHGDMISEPVDEATARRFASIPGYEMISQGGQPAPGTPDRTGDGTVTFADMNVSDIQSLLAGEPGKWEAVLAAETEARPGTERKGVMDAIEAAKARGAAE